MKLIEPQIFIESSVNQDEIMKFIEKAGRVCYKSEDKITESSAINFIRKIMESGHESVIEHYTITVRVICDRGVSHEIVRHRIASYSQESTRYCNYTQNKYGSELTFILPNFWNSDSELDKEKMEIWKSCMDEVEKQYVRLIQLGAKPEEARAILPNSIKTELVMTMNLREWRHFLKLRTSKRAHPQMRQIAMMILNEFKRIFPVFIEDINIDNK